MKKTIRLTETDLTRIVKRVLNETAVGSFIEEMIPELNKLSRRHNFSTKQYGSNDIYYNKETKDYIFRYEYARRKYVWGASNNITNITHRDDPDTLWIKKDIYEDIQNYIPSDEMILKWFNERYKKDAKVLKTHYNLKER